MSLVNGQLLFHSPTAMLHGQENAPERNAVFGLGVRWEQLAGGNWYNATAFPAVGDGSVLSPIVVYSKLPIGISGSVPAELESKFKWAPYTTADGTSVNTNFNTVFNDAKHAFSLLDVRSPEPGSYITVVTSLTGIRGKSYSLALFAAISGASPMWYTGVFLVEKTTKGNELRLGTLDTADLDLKIKAAAAKSQPIVILEDLDASPSAMNLYYSNIQGKLANPYVQIVTTPLEAVLMSRAIYDYVKFANRISQVEVTVAKQSLLAQDPYTRIQSLVLDGVSYDKYFNSDAFRQALEKAYAELIDYNADNKQLVQGYKKFFTAQSNPDNKFKDPEKAKVIVDSINAILKKARTPKAAPPSKKMQEVGKTLVKPDDLRALIAARYSKGPQPQQAPKAAVAANEVRQVAKAVGDALAPKGAAPNPTKTARRRPKLKVTTLPRGGVVKRRYIPGEEGYSEEEYMSGEDEEDNPANT